MAENALLARRPWQSADSSLNMQTSRAILAVLALLTSSPLSGTAPVGIALAQAAARQVGVTKVYDPAYVRIGYPNGDVPAYRPGDVVAWRLPGGLFHIGVVAGDRIAGTDRLYMIHNIGQGAREEDVLRAFEIIGHYRW